MRQISCCINYAGLGISPSANGAPDSAATSSAKHTGSGESGGSSAVARRWRRDATWLRSDAALRMSTSRQARQRSGRPGACASLGASSQLLHAASCVEQPLKGGHAPAASLCTASKHAHARNTVTHTTWGEVPAKQVRFVQEHRAGARAS